MRKGSIEDGKALSPDVFRPPKYGPYTIWREKTAAFIGSVFATVERQRFLESYKPSPDGVAPNVQDHLRDHLRRLASLRDRPRTWELQVDAEGLRSAIEERRFRSAADQIVTATEPNPEAPNRPESPSPLRSKLEAKHKEGTGYLRLLRPANHMVAVATFGRPISSDDLNVWHTEVEEPLKPHPKLLRAYHHEPLQPLALQQAESIAGFAYGGPEGARMRRALRQLAKVIDLC